MMLAKAKMFNDTETYNLILKAEHPREQKALGRKVKGFDADIWMKDCLDIVADIVYDKFSQFKSWKEVLMLTDPYVIVEASPTDKIWGIGMAEDNPDLLKTELWGKNLLGEALMNARYRIIKELK